MNDDVRMVTVGPDNVAQTGFFCLKSKPGAEGYQRKASWLARRLDEGLRLKILYEGRRSVGFVEYAPAEVAWRVVRAEGYLVIHCLWVVGRGKGKGHGSLLVQACLEEARSLGRRGVVMVTSSRTWLAGPGLLLKNGFVAGANAPPSFTLVSHTFGPGPGPRFPTDWDDRARRFGPGLTVVRTDQCPYIDAATRSALAVARERGLPARELLLESSQAVQTRAPSAYGVYNVVLDGALLTYRPVHPRALASMIDQRMASSPA